MDKIKILVVDDESRMRKLVKDFLEREGFEVLEAGDGMEAMEIFYEEKEIALIILDVMMPGMDGFQVLQKIREKSKEIIGQIRQTYDPGMEYRLIQKYNSYVMGVHNYYSIATHVNIDFHKIAFDVKKSLYNRLLIPILRDFIIAIICKQLTCIYKCTYFSIAFFQFFFPILIF